MWEAQGTENRLHVARLIIVLILSHSVRKYAKLNFKFWSFVMPLANVTCPKAQVIAATATGFFCPCVSKIAPAHL